MSARPASIWIALVLCASTAVKLVAGSSPVPLTASPGGLDRETVTASVCPTFSWSFVPGAETIHGFAQPLLEDGTPDEDAASIEWRVAGAVGSWSPSAGECLEAGRRYAWAVRAERVDGDSDWSPPRFLRAPDAPGAAELERALEVVRRHLAARERPEAGRARSGPSPALVAVAEEDPRGLGEVPEGEGRIAAGITLPSSLRVSRTGAASANAIVADRDGAGAAIYGVNSGSGNAGSFAGRVFVGGEPLLLGSLLKAEVAGTTDPLSLPTAVAGLNAASGTSGYLGQFGGGVVGNSTGAVPGVRGTNTGSGAAGRFEGDLEVTGALDCSGCVGPGDVADKTIGAEQLAPGAVTAGRIAANAVGPAEIAADAVGSSEIAANAVGSSEIAPGAVGQSEIVEGAITSRELADDGVTTNDIQNGTINNADVFGGVFYKGKFDLYYRLNSVQLAAGSVTDTVEASCDDSGDLPLTGWCFTNAPAVNLFAGAPTPDFFSPDQASSYRCGFYNPTTVEQTVEAGIVCIDKP